MSSVDFEIFTQDETSSVPSTAFQFTPPPSPKPSALLEPEKAAKQRKKPGRRHPASKELTLPRCIQCGYQIDLNELFRLHDALKQPIPEKKSRPANQKTKENFALWRQCVFEVTGAKAPVKSDQDLYAKVKELYESRTPKKEETKGTEVKVEQGEEAKV